MYFGKLATIVITGLLLTVSCNKEEEPTINPCLNGQLDAGETAVDCGGNCGDCPDTEYPSAGCMLNTSQTNVSSISFANKLLTYNNAWYLNINNDSLSVTLNLGNNGAIGSYSISPTGSSATLNGLNYLTLANGTCSISAHNLTTHKMTGFFNGKFVRSPGDTLYITNGYFQYLPY